MNVLMAKARIKAERVTEVQEAADRLFTAIDEAQPAGVRYAWLQPPDGETFIALVAVDDGAENPIPGLPEFREVQERLAGAFAETPDGAEALTVLGSYRLFRDA